MSDKHAHWKTDEMFRLLIEGVEDYAIFLLDPQGRVMSWNPGAERLLGYKETEMLGRHYSCLFTAEDSTRGEPEQELRTASKAGRSEDVRWHVRKDGTRFWGDGVVTALRNGDDILYYAKLLRDKTDQKELEDLLKHRAEALANADQQKNVFLATLAHELRNPLAGIVNAINILRLMNKDYPALEQPLQIMERQSKHIRRLIDDLTDVAKISTGKVQLHKERIELGNAVRNAVEATQPFIESRRHKLSISLPPEPIYLEADLVRLQQVFANLLTNAAKYTNEGGQITLSGTVQDSEIVVRIRDTGIGISAEMLPRIFELFTQIDPAKGYTQTGLGIGLALVKNLVELHGGSVQARSDGKDKGSEFTVRLPGGTAPPEEELAPRASTA
jgi:PAS domain S-box-containing protein